MLENAKYHPNVLVGESEIPGEVSLESMRLVDDATSNQSTAIGTSDRRICLFFSFDIVNSTSYKSLTANWPVVIRALLDTIVKKVDKEDALEGARLWRVIGDETVFILEIFLIDQLLPALQAIFYITQDIHAALSTGTFFQGIENQTLSSMEVSALAANNILSVKAAAWTAIIVEKRTKAYDSIIYRYELDASQCDTITEYLGEDIDAGFRLKEYTRSRHLVISFDLAKLLMFESIGASSYLTVIAYRKMKGVWNNRLYPIIWFHDRNASKVNGISDLDLDSTFSYDDAERDELIREFLLRPKSLQGFIKGESVDAQMYSIDVVCKKITADMGLAPKYEYYTMLFNEKKYAERRRGSQDVTLEMHCAVVCCDVENRKVMIVHRTAEHATNKEKWEFGCAKANSRQHLIETIADHYREAYDVEIELVMDHNRTADCQPLPIAVYEIGEPPQAHKGVIFVASAKPASFRHNSSHDMIRWITREEAREIAEKDAVNDFYRTIDVVYDRFEMLFPSDK